MFNRTAYSYVISGILSVILLVSSFLFAPANSALSPHEVKASGTTSDLSGYAWSDNIGWISFNCANTGTCGTFPYKVTLDTVTNNLTGNAWSDNIGWIQFGTTTGCPSGTCAARKSGSNILGWARALSGDGVNPVITAPGTTTYTTAGVNPFSVPVGVTSLTTVLTGGNGSPSTSTVAVTPGEPLNVTVGSGNNPTTLDRSGTTLATGSGGSGSGAGTTTSFGAFNTFTTAAGPHRVATGDLNGDGKPDVVATSYTSNVASVLLNNGSGGFGAKTDYAAGTYTYGVVLKDLNGDGKLDMVTSNITAGTVSVFLGNGNGTFGAKTDYTTAVNPYGLAVADVNGDGKPDIITANNASPYTISVLLGTGTGTFGAKTDYTTGTGPAELALADINGDGKLDVVTANQNAATAISVLFNSGTGTFPTHTDYANTGTGFNVKIADMDGDGKLDIVVINGTGQNASIYYNSGTNTFATRQDYTLTGGLTAVSWVAVGDIDGDGKPDMVVNANGAQAVLINTGSRTFAPSVNYLTGGPQGDTVELADFNADGKLDMVSPVRIQNTVTVALNTSSAAAPSFGPVTGYTAVAPHKVVLNDVDGDGKKDIIDANTGASSVSVWKNTGSGTFSAKADYTTGSSPTDVALVDLNNDGKPDMVTANNVANTASVLLNNGSGGFGAKTDYGTGSGPSGIAVGDVNNDGKPDMVVCNSTTNTASVLLNSGTGTFGAKTDFTVGAGPSGVELKDVNGDGKLDIVTSNQTANTASVLLGNGNGTFGAKTDYPTGSGPAGVAVRDVNGDGKADIVTSNQTANTASVLINSGTGTFGAKTDYPISGGSQNVVLSDINGDGNTDIITSATTINGVSICLGNGNGTFGTKNDYSTGGMETVAVGDVDNNGMDDLVVARPGVTPTIGVVLNTLPPPPSLNPGSATLTYTASTASLTNGSDGWISLSSTNGGSGTYGVGFGIGELNGFAWGSDVVGWISMNCADGGPGGSNICATSPYKVTYSSLCSPSNVCSADLTQVVTTDSWCTVATTTCGVGLQCSGGVCVAPPSVPPSLVSFVMVPKKVHRGMTATATWQVDNTASCVLKVGGATGLTKMTGIPSATSNVNPVANTTEPIQGQVTYTLWCTDASNGGTLVQVGAPVTVGVVPNVKEQ